MGSESFDCREGSGKALDERKDPSVVSQRKLLSNEVHRPMLDAHLLNRHAGRKTAVRYTQEGGTARSMFGMSA